MTTMLIIAITAGSLVGGAALGAWEILGGTARNLLLALAGGALIQASMQELIEPAVELLPLWQPAVAVLAGAVLFSLAKKAVSAMSGSGAGLGLALAITFDGVPENLALGTVLQGAAGPLAVAAFAGAIVLSNLPEAAGGAADMREDGKGAGYILGFWAGIAALLAAAVVLGSTAFKEVSDGTNALVQCFAAGAIVASLAIEVFPDAFENRDDRAGVAVALGLLIAVGLHQLAG